MNLLKAAMTVSGMTLLSRITGLIRETLTARLLGAGIDSDAFFIAFRIPNLLRRLFAEGAFSQAFVPILSQTRTQEGEAATADLVSKTATVLMWVLLLLTIVGVVGAPWVVWMMASGLEGVNPDSYALTVLLTRWMFPYILFISMVALASGVLNTYRHFSVPAVTPVLLNLSFIVAVLVVAPYLSKPVYAMAGAVMVGGILQLAVQLPVMAKLNVLPHVGFTWFRVRQAVSDPRVRRILTQMLPASLAVSVAQISLIINTNIASHLGSGSVSWISFGDRLMEFPTAMLGVALGTVLLPTLSRASAAGDEQQYRAMLDWGLRLTLLLALPAAVGLATMAVPLTAILFHYGRFNEHDLLMTSHAVLAYSVGLLGLIAVKVLAPGFYAKQDVRTPVKIGIAVVIATQLMNLVFVPMFGHAGLPLAVGLGATLNALTLLLGLIYRGVYNPLPGWLGFGMKVLLANVGMGCMLWFCTPMVDWVAMQAQPMLRISQTLGFIALAGVVYGAILWGLGLDPRTLFKRPQASTSQPQPD